MSFISGGWAGKGGLTKRTMECGLVINQRQTAAQPGTKEAPAVGLLEEGAQPRPVGSMMDLLRELL
jgi:hypothetical protein